MNCLMNLALDINAGNGNCNSDVSPINVSTIINDVMKTSEKNEEKFNCEIFFRFISYDIANNNIGNMLYFSPPLQQIVSCTNTGTCSIVYHGNVL